MILGQTFLTLRFILALKIISVAATKSIFDYFVVRKLARR
jgi:hypothetical protein